MIGYYLIELSFLPRASVLDHPVPSHGTSAAVSAFREKRGPTCACIPRIPERVASQNNIDPQPLTKKWLLSTLYCHERGQKKTQKNMEPSGDRMSLWLPSSTLSQLLTL